MHRSRTQEAWPASGERRGTDRKNVFMMVRDRENGTLLWATDLSTGGLKCETRIPRLPGSMASVDFWLPGDRRSITAQVQVITLDEAQGGRIVMRMRFCNIDDASRVRIERFLSGRKVNGVFPMSRSAA